MTRRRCCEDPANLAEVGRDGLLLLLCRECGTVLAEADDRGELFASY